MQVWNQTELEFLRDNLTLSTKDLYEEFREEFGSNRSYDSIQKKVKKLRDAFDTGDFDSDEDTEQQLIEMFSCQKDSHIIAPVPPATKIANNERKLKFIKELIEETPKFKMPKAGKPVKSKDSSLVMVLSDTHCGQQNKGFGIQEFKERLAEYPSLVHRQIANHQVDEVVINMVGDMLEGEDIYPTQPWHVVCPTIDQLEIATNVFWEMSLSAREIFDCPVRLVCVPGNHGRTGQTTNEKTNWDNVLYHCLKILVGNTDSKGISIEHSGEPFQRYDVKDRIGLLYHQGVKHTGTPAMREKIAGWVESNQCDFIVSGHYHEWKIGSWHKATVIANGSLCGPNDLSDRMAQNTPARQGFFLVTPNEPLGHFGYIEWEGRDEIPLNQKEQQQ